ncbi:hypothetical protein ACFOD9_11765 [Novosphingobium bradum]|uniref:Uncharacterized protein n=1 Tax=Novosphingobium bradum TaxID=1737444 RepID=A0ABV7IUP1_9SPHN
MAGRDEMTREERLAAKLRENLRRRKAQARALGGSDGGNGSDGDNGGDGGAESGESLPKPQPSR